METEIRKVFGSDLIIQKHLGQEEETQVYQAKYQNQNILLKVILRKNLKNFNQLLIEIGFIRYLSQYISSQKHIYRCLKLKLTPDYLFLLLEKPQGQTLANFFKNLSEISEMDWEKYQRLVTMIMFRLLLGINYIHKKGVAHRGINPETIHLIYKDSLVEDLRLSDFAVSCGKYMALPLEELKKELKKSEFDSETGEYDKLCQTIDLEVVNPPENDHPEILVKKIKSLAKNQTRNTIYLYLAKKADIWALGILFWKLLNCNSLKKNPLEREFPTDYKKNDSWKKYQGHKNKLLEGVHNLVVQFMLSQIPNRGKSHEILETMAIHYKYFEEDF